MNTTIGEKLEITIMTQMDTYISIIQNNNYCYNKDNQVVYSSPSIYSKPKAKLEIYQVLTIKKCNLIWCEIKNAKINGWIKKKYLWAINEHKINIK